MAILPLFMQANTSNQKNERLFKFLMLLIIVGGIGLRLVVYLQNRNLIIDEANVARNIYERGFIDLVKPLSYEQYAPPLFLWLIKLSSIIFGFSEYALKLYPFISGIIALYLFYLLLKKLLSPQSIWLPLALFASGYFFIRYATELKQYNNDVLVMLALMLLTLRNNIIATSSGKFFVIWAIAGSIAIWFSMPSVFVLAGVGFYYGLQLIRQKELKKLTTLTFASAIWMIQFLAYYIIILRPQANSNYLQSFHHDYFLYLTPTSVREILFNLSRLEILIGTISGDTVVAVAFLSLTIVAGIIRLLKKDLNNAVLILTPLAALMLAAGLKQFSLIPRVSLFGIVLLLILAGYGFDYLLSISGRVVKMIIILPAIYILSATLFNTTIEPFKYEELTEGMQYVIDKKIPGDYLSLYHSCAPAFIYYTQIHPDKNKWASLKNADILKYDTPYGTLSWQMHYVWSSKGPFAFIFTNETQEEFAIRRAALDKNLKEAAFLDKPEVKVLIMQED